MRLSGVGGLVTVWMEVKAGGRFACRKEGKGLLAGLAIACRCQRLVVCWACGVAGDSVDDSGKAGSGF